MTTSGRPDTELNSEQELDELLAEEAGMSLEELREQGDVDLPPPWEADIIADHNDPE